MKILFNELPNISYQFDINDYTSSFDEGYATPIEENENASALVFKNVEDHIDGNGMCILWLIKGSGQFYYDGSPLDMVSGDVLVFDDNTEHGFISDKNEPCIAINIVLGNKNNWDLQYIKEKISNINNAKIETPLRKNKM